jgi:DNA-directed RNA polymerase subunit RPC12/RpoP
MKRCPLCGSRSIAQPWREGEPWRCVGCGARVKISDPKRHLQLVLPITEATDAKKNVARHE